MNKGKLIVLVGISGSGKSTWAHDQWADNPDTTVIVNRDKIRELLFGFTESTVGEYYMRKVGKTEKQVTRYEDTLINEALSFGKTVIVDATHLAKKYLNRYKYWNVPVELKMFEVDVQEALLRDATRGRVVGEEVIMRQYSKFINLVKELEARPIDFTPVTFNNPTNKKACVIFDIDGTLAHMNGRSPYEWSRVGEDDYDKSTCDMAQIVGEFGRGVEVIICTGRDGVCLPETKAWLTKWGIPHSKIYIRDKGDQRPDWMIKEEMWRDISKTHGIIGMFDDRLQVVRRARALGLKVFNVEYNNF